MKRETVNSPDIKRLAYLAILSALVVVTQLLSIPVGGIFETSALTMAVIVIGSAILGIKAGGLLGLVFGIVVLMLPGTQFYLTFGDNRFVSVFCTLLVVLFKGVLAGLASGAVYKLIERFNRYLGVLCAGICAVTVNTGIFIIGSLLFFEATFAAIMTISLLISYLIELGTSVVISSAALRIISINKK